MMFGDVKGAAEKLYADLFHGPRPAAPYINQSEFARRLRDVAECGLFDARHEARRQFMLRDIANAEDIDDIRRVLSRIVNED